MHKGRMAGRHGHKHGMAGVLCLLLCLATFAWAQPVRVPPDWAQTPSGALTAFRVWTDPANPRPRQAGQVLHAPHLNRTERGRLAMQLRYTLEGLGLYLRPGNIPDDSLDLYVPFRSLPDFQLVRVGTQWRISPHTVENIPRMYSRVFPFGREGWLHDMPRWWRRETLGLWRWQWMGLLVVTLFAWLTYRLVRGILRPVLRRILHRLRHLDEGIDLAGPSAQRLSLLAVLLLLQVVLPLLQLPPGLFRWLTLGLRVAVPLYIVLVIYKIIDVVGEYATRRTSATEVNAVLVPLMGRVVKILVVVTGLVLVLRNLEYDVTTLLAGSALAGLALALAAQDTLKNFFGSLMILWDKPFRIGDFIIAPDVRGIVQEVGLRATRVRTFDNSILYVPNSKLTDSVVENMGARDFIRYLLDVGLHLDTPADQVEAFCTHLRQWIETHPKTRKDFHQVFLHQLSDSAQVVRINLHMKAFGLNEENQVRHEFNLFVLRTAQALGIALAYPSQTLYLGRHSMPPSDSVLPGMPLPPLPGAWPPNYPTMDNPEPPGFDRV